MLMPGYPTNKSTGKLKRELMRNEAISQYNIMTEPKFAVTTATRQFFGAALNKNLGFLRQGIRTNRSHPIQKEQVTSETKQFTHTCNSHMNEVKSILSQSSMKNLNDLFSFVSRLVSNGSTLLPSEY